MLGVYCYATLSAASFSCHACAAPASQVQGGGTAVAGSGASNGGEGGRGTGQADGGAAAGRGRQQHEEVDSEEEGGYEEEAEYDARQDPRLGPFAAANTERVAPAAASSNAPNSAGPRQAPPLPQSPQPQQLSPQQPQQQPQHQQAGAGSSPAPGRTEDVTDLLSTKMLQVGAAAAAGSRRVAVEGLSFECHLCLVSGLTGYGAGMAPDIWEANTRTHVSLPLQRRAGLSWTSTAPGGTALSCTMPCGIGAGYVLECPTLLAPQNV